jgi:hypothetical protein
MQDYLDRQIQIAPRPPEATGLAHQNEERILPRSKGFLKQACKIKPGSRPRQESAYLDGPAAKAEPTEVAVPARSDRPVDCK